MANILSIYHQEQPQQLTPQYEQAGPLWQRVPTRDRNGKPLSDFMMIFPLLNFTRHSETSLVLDHLQQVLHHYRSYVVFADLNLKLKLLWVSIYPFPGMCLEISTAINQRIPEAKLVSHRF